MQYFAGWARRIASGDVLSRTVSPPLHGWHLDAADAYLRDNPRKVQELSRGCSPEDSLCVERALWREWCGTPRFYQDPLYPYVLGGLFKLLGPHALPGILLNGLAGVLTNLLLGLMAWRLFGRTAGLLTASAAMLCAPIHVFDFTLLRESWVILLSVLLVYSAERTRAAPTSWRWLRLGMIWGLAISLKSIFLLFLPGIAWGLLGAKAPVGGARIRYMVILGCGVVLTTFPWLVRDMLLGLGPGFPRSAEVNFVLGNSVSSTSANWFFSTEQMAGIFAGALKKGFLGVAAETIRTHPGWTAYLALAGQKAWATLNWFEIPNNVNVYYFMLHSSVLRAMAVNAGIVVPFAAVGLVPAVRGGGDAPLPCW